MKERRHEAVQREAQALAENVRRAREDIRNARARLKQRNVGRDELVDLEKAVNRVAQDVGAFGPLEPGARERGRRAEAAEIVPVSDLRKGKRVYIARLRAEAEIVDITGNTARVAAGALKLTVPLSELLRVGAGDRGEERDSRDASRGKRAEGPARSTDESKLEVPFQTTDNTCDVRGLLSDDAVSMTMTFLDRAIGAGQRVVFVIHGHGTGALRDRIRRELKTSRYVAYSRAGAQNEGGDGATIVWLM